MGLGPPVCERCRVIANFVASIEHRYTCKYCGNKNPQWNAWDCGLTQEELDDNKRFLDFVKGTQDASTSG